jgi:hypothetical protein
MGTASGLDCCLHRIWRTAILDGKFAAKADLVVASMDMGMDLATLFLLNHLGML